MANNTIRISTSPNNGDKYIKVKLEQSFDFIEILSLKITQEDAYRTFCADYGVIVGRVIINSGFGVPNAKVSIFIPIDDVDSTDSQIKGLYPYELVTDKDSDGIRYNLLPRQPETTNECFTPIGTFPSKREILDNVDVLEIYKKYYKFTTTTNHAGDFMIFGVPLGTHTVHVDADISDIGIASQRPYDSISQGTPLKMFESSTKYKGGTNLDKLIQVKSVNTGVNVQPFWGDKDSCELGITRIDIDLNYNITPSAIFMGSIFGDHDKNSVNKNCRHRDDMGNLCDQITNEGTVEMIRETIDGNIEQFDVNGGRVIDNNGAWAYQIPMNLDYVVTDETGNLVLSDDPNKGIPTRANVRFRIGMDQSGSEGRLRTRAKYLVPHNPTAGKQAEIDYEFGDKTKKTSLRNIYWNKIYSVSNFISRYQTTNFLGGKTSTTTGIKDVDDCVGNKNPFPYNRVSVTTNPLFFIICLIIKIVGFLIAIINSAILPLINGIINVLNGVFHALCSLHNVKILGGHPFGFIPCPDDLNYIPCLYVSCGDEGQTYHFAPGCFKNSAGWSAGDHPDYFPEGDDSFIDLVGLDDCISFQMAAFLGIFEFDFYNDWINGSLYGFLLKYKKKGKRERFCDYECQTTSNSCHDNFLSDNNYLGAKSTDEPDNYTLFTPLREGLIKKFNNEFYYAASTHDASKKMFATEIINLGSVFSCDWQGVPKIQQYLIESTYKLPPLFNEISGDSKTVLTTGQCSLGKDAEGTSLFFDISCNGLSSTQKHVLNIRHICEFGVELDELRDNQPPDGIIGVSDLDLDEGDKPKLFRDVFYALNVNTNSFSVNLPYATNFNLKDDSTYNFALQFDKGREVNGVDYVKFRGYNPSSNSVFAQPTHSYFFYFGLNPGKTGLDKLNQDFFAVCRPSNVRVFNVDIKTISTTYGVNNNGKVTFTFFNGAKPITYTVTGPNNYYKTGSVGANNTDPIFTLTNLVTGEYTIVATDSVGNTLNQGFVISPAPALYAEAFVSKSCTSISIPDGEITITAVGGGNPAADGSYTYVLYNASGAKVAGPTLFNQIPTIIGGLSVSTQQNFTPISFNTNVFATNNTTFSTIPRLNSTTLPITPAPSTLTTFNLTNRLTLATPTPTSNTFSSSNLINRASFSTGLTTTTPALNFTRANNLFSTSQTGVLSFNTVIPITKLVTPVVNTYKDIPNLLTYLSAGAYTLIISDSSNNYVAIPNLIMNGVSQITLTSTKIDVLCARDKSGTIELKPIGGQTPYTFKTTNAKGFSSTSQKITGLSADTYTSTVTDKNKITDTVVTTIVSKYPDITIVAGSPADLKQQCSSDKYVLSLLLTSPYGAGNDVNLEFNIDNGVDTNNNEFWEPITLKFVDNQTPLKVTIPLNYASVKYENIVYSDITDNIRFRVSNDTKTCYSNIVQMLIENITLPMTPLTISKGADIVQTSPYQVKFNFNISYTPEDIKNRGPFTVKYIVTALSHGQSQDSALNTTKITNNLEIITGNVPYVGQYPADGCKVSVYVIDNTGCQSPNLNIGFYLP